MTALATASTDIAPDSTVHSWAESTSAQALTFAAARDSWRAFEQDAVMTPYGRFEWAAAMSAAASGKARAVLFRDPSGSLLAILPLIVERRAGLLVASSVGGKHANYTLPLLRPGLMERLSKDTARAMLAQAARSVGADAVSLSQVPVEWDGCPNPFAALGQPAASTAASLLLSANGDATLARSMSAEARKKLRAKIRGLEKSGPVELRQAVTRDEVELILGAFLDQKAARFRSLGIHDPFATEEMRRALRSGALAGLDRREPAIELYGLDVAGRIVAVFGGAADARRFSGMFLSFADGPEARFSPGEVLVTSVIRRLCEQGRTTFDLGVGEARYKSSICDSADALVEIDLAVSWLGRGYVRARGAALGCKLRLKASPRVMATLAWSRRRLAAIRG